MIRRVNILYSFALLFASHTSLMVTYLLSPEGNRLAGQSYTVTVPDHNTQLLETFAAQYGQGLSDMLGVNPGADVLLSKSGSQLAIPQQLILSTAVRKRIVVNIAGIRPYYYPPDSSTVEVFPIGTGRTGRETPRNQVTTVEYKQEIPTWTPTPNTRCGCAKQEESLSAFVPVSPDNPMGLYVIYIGRLYAIRGINANFGVGLRVSQSCIRPRSDDIRYLFDNVPVGTRVQIIDQPVRYTIEPGGSNRLEVHEPLSYNHAEYESGRKVPLPVTSSLRAFISGQEVDINRANAALQNRSEMPVRVGSGSRQMS